MATNSFDDNAPSLSTSIPSENHSNAHLTDTDFDLTAPAAPEDGAPENLEGGRPVYPDNTSSGSNIVLWPPASSVDPILSNVPVPSKLFQQHEPIWTGAFLKCVCQYLRSQH